MTQRYLSQKSELFNQWLTEVLKELLELGHTRKVTVEEYEWLENTWTSFKLSPAEAAQSFIIVNPA